MQPSDHRIDNTIFHRTGTSTLCGKHSFFDFSLLPLVLSAAKDGSEFETQSPVLVYTGKTCEGSLAFILQDKVIADYLFGKLLKPILADEDELGEVVNMVVKDSELELKIRGSSIGQINN